MPYIKKEQRTVVDKEIKALADAIRSAGKENRAGIMNYSISCLLKNLYELRYSEINEAIGMLECAKQEYYRRVAGPYEDKKIKENGDV